MRLAYHSRNTDTTGDGAIDARDMHSIMTVFADGSNTQQLSGVASNDKDPAWSPDARWIAYVGQEDSTGDGVVNQSDCSGIYIVAADGSSINRITPVDMFAAGPDWSPDGTRLAFYGTTQDTDGDGYLTERDNTNIYLINVDGSGMVQVTLDHNADFAPDFAPDGSKLAFASRAADTSGDGLIGIYDNASIFVVGVDGSNLTQITVNATEDQMPKWSPEGRRLVFVSWTSDNNLDGYIGADYDIPGIFVIEANGANLARLTDSGVYATSPTWNPEGTRIAYVVRHDTDADGQMRYNDAGYLFITDGGGNLTAQLTDDTFGTLLPTWSPDGSMIAFHSWTDINGDGEIRYPDMPNIFVIRIEDAARIQVSDNAYADFGPVWSAGGSN